MTDQTRAPRDAYHSLLDGPFSLFACLDHGFTRFRGNHGTTWVREPDLLDDPRSVWLRSIGEHGARGPGAFFDDQGVPNIDTEQTEQLVEPVVSLDLTLRQAAALRVITFSQVRGNPSGLRGDLDRLDAALGSAGIRWSGDLYQAARQRVHDGRTEGIYFNLDPEPRSAKPAPVTRDHLMPGEPVSYGMEDGPRAGTTAVDRVELDRDGRTVAVSLECDRRFKDHGQPLDYRRGRDGIFRSINTDTVILKEPPRD